MMASYLLNEHEIKEIIAKKFNTSTDKIFITADESGKIIVKVDYNVVLFNDKCRIIGQYNERGISYEDRRKENGTI